MNINELEKDIEKAFHVIHDNLQWMPEQYCCWKKKSADGRAISKSLSGDYRPLYYFVVDPSLRNNIAELRFCFDYHHSLYKLHKPGLTFGWQHKLVLCQIVAGIYEGLLYDLFYYLSQTSDNDLLRVLAKNRLDNKKDLSLRTLIKIFHETGTLSDQWQTYLTSINYLRDTVHPKSLNDPKASFQQNPVITKSIDNLEKNIEQFRRLIKRKYR